MTLWKQVSPLMEDLFFNKTATYNRNCSGLYNSIGWNSFCYN